MSNFKNKKKSLLSSFPRLSLDNQTNEHKLLLDNHEIEGSHMKSNEIPDISDISSTAINEKVIINIINTINSYIKHGSNNDSHIQKSILSIVSIDYIDLFISLIENIFGASQSNEDIWYIYKKYYSLISSDDHDRIIILILTILQRTIQYCNQKHIEVLYYALYRLIGYIIEDFFSSNQSSFQYKLKIQSQSKGKYSQSRNKKYEYKSISAFINNFLPFSIQKVICLFNEILQIYIKVNQSSIDCIYEVLQAGEAYNLNQILFKIYFSNELLSDFISSSHLQSSYMTINKDIYETSKENNELKERISYYIYSFLYHNLKNVDSSLFDSSEDIDFFKFYLFDTILKCIDYDQDISNIFLIEDKFLLPQSNIPNNSNNRKCKDKTIRMKEVIFLLEEAFKVYSKRILYSKRKEFQSFSFVLWSLIKRFACIKLFLINYFDKRLIGSLLINNLNDYIMICLCYFRKAYNQSDNEKDDEEMISATSESDEIYSDNDNDNENEYEDNENRDNNFNDNDSILYSNNDNDDNQYNTIIDMSNKEDSSEQLTKSTFNENESSCFKSSSQIRSEDLLMNIQKDIIKESKRKSNSSLIIKPYLLSNYMEFEKFCEVIYSLKSNYTFDEIQSISKTFFNNLSLLLSYVIDEKYIYTFFEGSIFIYIYTSYMKFNMKGLSSKVSPDFIEKFFQNTLFFIGELKEDETYRILTIYDKVVDICNDISSLNTNKNEVAQMIISKFYIVVDMFLSQGSFGCVFIKENAFIQNKFICDVMNKFFIHSVDLKRKTNLNDECSNSIHIIYDEVKNVLNRFIDEMYYVFCSERQNGKYESFEYNAKYLANPNMTDIGNKEKEILHHNHNHRNIDMNMDMKINISSNITTVLSMMNNQLKIILYDIETIFNKNIPMINTTFPDSLSNIFIYISKIFKVIVSIGVINENLVEDQILQMKNIIIDSLYSHLNHNYYDYMKENIIKNVIMIIDDFNSITNIGYENFDKEVYSSNMNKDKERIINNNSNNTYSIYRLLYSFLSQLMIRLMNNNIYEIEKYISRIGYFLYDNNLNSLSIYEIIYFIETLSEIVNKKLNIESYEKYERCLLNIILYINTSTVVSSLSLSYKNLIFNSISKLNIMIIEYTDFIYNYLSISLLFYELTDDNLFLKLSNSLVNSNKFNIIIFINISSLDYITSIINILYDIYSHSKINNITKDIYMAIETIILLIFKYYYIFNKEIIKRHEKIIKQSLSEMKIPCFYMKHSEDIDETQLKSREYYLTYNYFSEAELIFERIYEILLSNDEAYMNLYCLYEDQIILYMKYRLYYMIIENEKELKTIDILRIYRSNIYKGLCMIFKSIGKRIYQTINNESLTIRIEYWRKVFLKNENMRKEFNLVMSENVDLNTSVKGMIINLFDEFFYYD